MQAGGRQHARPTSCCRGGGGKAVPRPVPKSAPKPAPLRGGGRSRGVK